MSRAIHTLISGGNMATPHQRNHILNQKPALLLHFDGADAATATSDSGGTGHTINFNGDAQLDTDQSKFFGSSLLLDGSIDYLSINDHADWDILTNSTIDFWVKHTHHSGTECYISQYEDSSNWWELRHSHTDGIRLLVSIEGNFRINIYGGEIIDTNWHHIALCKVGNNYGLYKDGVQFQYVSYATIYSFAGLLYIGNLGPGQTLYFNGHLDEIRIVQGNPFGAAPVVGLTDKITVPCLPYTSWR